MGTRSAPQREMPIRFGMGKKETLVLQKICDEIIGGGKLKGTRKRSGVDWRRSSKFIGATKPYDAKAIELHVLLGHWMKVTLRILYASNKERFDNRDYYYGYLAASRIVRLIRMLGQTHTETTIEDVEEELGVNLDYNWWLGFLDSSIPQSWYDKAVRELIKISESNALDDILY